MSKISINKVGVGYDINAGGGILSLDKNPIATFHIGAIYLTIDNISPASLFGGSWERVAQGRALFGAGTLNGIDYSADTTKDAGLPNIDGHFELYGSDTGRPYMTFSGAFYTYGTETGNRRLQGLTSGNSATKHKGANFDASRCNSIYGKSDTVQPNAYVINVWRRIA